ncbi:MAG: hypothetical protein GF309_10120 [Candidatus Lokiarchaeota archaeon]|nr:hypothetical protein [Candidatus Lokiarchaeota archaeon]
MDSKNLKGLFLILVIVGAAAGFIHLYGMTSTAYAIDQVSNSGSVKSISILRERDPDQAFLIVQLENPTNLDVKIGFDESYAVTLDSFTATGLLSGSREEAIEPHGSIEFQMIATLSEGWTATDDNLTITVAGELEISTTSLWVQKTRTRELDFTDYYEIFES